MTKFGIMARNTNSLASTWQFDACPRFNIHRKRYTQLKYAMHEHGVRLEYTWKERRCVKRGCMRVSRIDLKMSSVSERMNTVVEMRSTFRWLPSWQSKRPARKAKIFVGGTARK